VLTVLIEPDDGSVDKPQRACGGFTPALEALGAGLVALAGHLVVMDSTGRSWKRVYAALEKAGIAAHGGNARQGKPVPGRTTDGADSAGLAPLGRVGLVTPSVLPPQDLREVRLGSRSRQQLAPTGAAEKNRLHKLLDAAGSKRGAGVSDSHGVSARAMLAGRIAGEPLAQLPPWAPGQLRHQHASLEQALNGAGPPRHRLVLQQIEGPIRSLEAALAPLDTSLSDAMAPYADSWHR
jgi:transposase